MREGILGLCHNVSFSGPPTRVLARFLTQLPRLILTF